VCILLTQREHLENYYNFIAFFSYMINGDDQQQQLINFNSKHVKFSCLSAKKKKRASECETTKNLRKHFLLSLKLLLVALAPFLRQLSCATYQIHTHTQVAIAKLNTYLSLSLNVLLLLMVGHSFIHSSKRAREMRKNPRGELSNYELVSSSENAHYSICSERGELKAA
jgi:hypothetical protein